jgi:hypothetical protein
MQFIFSPEERKDAHTIISEQLTNPLSLRGVISYFNARCPTEDEVLDPDKYLHVIMTAPKEWDPYDPQMTEIEDAMMLQLKENKGLVIGNRILSIAETTHQWDPGTPDLYDPDVRKVLVTSSNNISNTGSIRKGAVSPEQLAKRSLGSTPHNVPLKDRLKEGRGTLVYLGELNARLKHTAHQLMFRHIRTTIYTDTMFAKQKSLRQNTCAQVYVTTFHWTKIFPMKQKSDAHQTLDRLHKEVGVFSTIVPDNAPELVSGDFRWKVVHPGSRIKLVEAYTHNQNLAESAIQEVRRMYRKAMLSTSSPHILWDYCLELMGDLRSHTTLDIPELDGDTLQTRITGDTVDISHLCEFSWFDTVWYVDPLDKMEN